MADVKPPRAYTLREVEVSVLDGSRRRCALCFYVSGDLSEKHGQIAHLDGTRSIAKEDNLAFLCLEHHSLYDSATKQHKGYTTDEAKKARDMLYEAIEKGFHLTTQGTLVRGRTADRETFEAVCRLLPSNGSIQLMRETSFGECFRWEALDDVQKFRSACAGPDAEFLDGGLEKHRLDLLSSISTFVHMLAANSFRLEGTSEDPLYKVPDEWHYKNPQHWHEIVDALNTAADEVVHKYEAFVRECRRRLLS